MFQSCPNCPAFEGLLWIIWFLASHLNWPLIYGHQHTSTHLKIVWNNDTKDDVRKFDKNVDQFSDFSFASIPIDKSSYAACSHTYNGTCFAWKTSWFLFICLHLTNAEFCIFYFAAILTMQYRLLLRSMNLLQSSPTIAHVDNQSTIDIVNLHKITPRVWHIDIPIHYMQ